MPEVQIRVRQMTPSPWGSNEWEWPKLLAQQARLCEVDRAGISSKTRFSVRVRFFLGRNLSRADLDNLAKPVLDTLFQPYQPQVKDLSLTGALFQVDDSSVYQLCLEKLLVSDPSEEGADISIFWDS